MHDITGCHQATKDMNMDIKQSIDTAKAITQKAPPYAVKSVFVKRAYKVRVTVTPAVIPAAAITLFPVYAEHMNAKAKAWHRVKTKSRM